MSHTVFLEMLGLVCSNIFPHVLSLQWPFQGPRVHEKRTLFHTQKNRLEGRGQRTELGVSTELLGPALPPLPSWAALSKSLLPSGLPSPVVKNERLASNKSR